MLIAHSSEYPPEAEHSGAWALFHPPLHKHTTVYLQVPSLMDCDSFHSCFRGHVRIKYAWVAALKRAHYCTSLVEERLIPQ